MNELDEIIKRTIWRCFLDGFLEGVALYRKPREEYTPAEENVYQQGERLAKEYVLSTKEDNGND